jgi:hypothetical protein
VIEGRDVKPLSSRDDLAERALLILLAILAVMAIAINLKLL